MPWWPLSERRRPAAASYAHMRPLSASGVFIGSHSLRQVKLPLASKIGCPLESKPQLCCSRSMVAAEERFRLLSCPKPTESEPLHASRLESASEKPLIFSLTAGRSGISMLPNSSADSLFCLSTNSKRAKSSLARTNCGLRAYSSR